MHKKTKEKYLIFQYYKSSTGKVPEFVLASMRNVSTFAKMNKYDYKFMQHSVPLSPYYGIFSPVFDYTLCQKYDGYLFLDSDVLINHKNAEQAFLDLFENHDCEIAAWCMNNGDLNTRPVATSRYFGKYGHFNSGVVFFRRQTYLKLRIFVILFMWLHFLNPHSTIVAFLRRLFPSVEFLKNQGGYDQQMLNLYVRLLVKKSKFQSLDSSYNYHLGRLSVDGRINASVVHYHRNCRDLIYTDFHMEERFHES